MKSPENKEKKEKYASAPEGDFAKSGIESERKKNQESKQTAHKAGHRGGVSSPLPPPCSSHASWCMPHHRSSPPCPLCVCLFMSIHVCVCLCVGVSVASADASSTCRSSACSASPHHPHPGHHRTLRPSVHRRVRRVVQWGRAVLALSCRHTACWAMPGWCGVTAPPESRACAAPRGGPVVPPFTKGVRRRCCEGLARCVVTWWWWW